MALAPFQRSNSSIRSSSSLSSSSHPLQWTYDVFLSFRGEDTRDNFLSHLYKELKRKGINTFIDDKELQRGKKISPELLKAIDESMFSIVIISENYASSSWCLDELVRIRECNDARGQIVYPVFYRVDPSDVRKQKGNFGKRFDELVSKLEMEMEMEMKMEKVQSWKKALKEVGNLAGFTFPNPAFGSESKLIEEIVGKIFDYLNVYSSVDEGLVGMDSHMEEVIKLLGLGNDDVRIVGIWGMGGIGKTTIAQVVYDRISWQFDGCCFNGNVRAVSKECGIMFLQEQLVSKILIEKDRKVSSISSGKSMIKRIISHKKVLIVLDDVDESIDLENLLGEHDWFSSGSKIIITTRDLHVLKACGATHTYKVHELKKDEAVKLLISKAFRKDKQIGGYGNLLGRAVEYCKGVPLALKVLGSFLHDRKKIYWESALKRLEQSPLPKVEEVLKISYDALGWEDKEIFLDIAFFFKQKYINDVTKILESFGFQPTMAIELLVEKSLIIISHGRLFMHDLIQEMGRNIVRQESPKEPGQRSRLWLYEDIKHVLMNDTGTEKLEGIVMKYPDLENRDPKDFGFPEELKLSGKAFAKMTSLRILIIRSFVLSEDLKYLPNNLRYLDWRQYPLRCLPSEFRPMCLVELHITFSNIEQLWMGTEVLHNLRTLNLSYSEYLTMSPDFKKFPNLESLYLVGCENLVNLHPSIGSLRRLVGMNLSGCKNLESLPSGTELESLKIINAYGCSKLKTLGSFEHTKCLQRLVLAESSISELPLTVGHLTNLKSLVLRCCKNLTSVPKNIGQLKALKSLILSRCSKLQKLPEEVNDLVSLLELNVAYTRITQLPYSICRLCYLTVLHLEGNNFESLPSSMSQLKLLKEIYLSNCKKLQELPELSSDISVIEARHCKSLRKIASPFLYKDIQRFDFFNCVKLVENKESNILTDEFISNLFQGSISREIYQFRIKFPGSDIPKWFNHQFNSKSSVCLKFNSRCVGIAIAVVAIGVENVLDFLWFDMRHKTVRVLNPQIEWDTDFTCIKSKNVEVIYVTRGNVLFDSAVENLNEGEEFKVEWDFCEEIEVEWNSRETVVQKCGVRWVCKEDFERNDHQASQDDNLIVVSQGVENANNAPLKRRPSGSGDFQEEDCPNIKRPRLAQPNRVEQVGAWKKRKSPKRKKMKVTWFVRDKNWVRKSAF
ncbi:TMV resistance protein N-like [Camellia sinensis]|uniref:TMV resistance protein N-like n=1 Tax=Camellia sinensis TaxID=4442 RepID=UPI001036595C|nr:TMV resistance protein N-like [Camellia sinensis]